VLERPVGGGDRRGTDLEGARELADGRKPLSRCELVLGDRALDPRRDRRRAGSCVDRLY